MHPHNIVYNPATLERLVTETNATHVGAEMDPSHLFWQGIDPVQAVDAPRRARLQRRRQGHPHQRGGRGQRRPRRPASTGSPPDEPGAVALGGRYTLSRWPKASSWDFVAVGRGHDVGVVDRVPPALDKVDPDMAVNIEHEDQELDQLEGLAPPPGSCSPRPAAEAR